MKRQGAAKGARFPSLCACRLQYEIYKKREERKVKKEAKEKKEKKGSDEQMTNKFADIGKDTMINIEEIMSVHGVNKRISEPLRKYIIAKVDKIIDCTNGQKTRSIIITKEGKIYKSVRSKNTLMQNIAKWKEE